MSESYFCDGEPVHFSNGACQELQLAWARIAAAKSHGAAMKELAESLRERSSCASGVAAIGIDEEYLEEPYSRREIKAAWLEVMKLLLEDIARHGHISRRMDVSWNDELRDSWLERLQSIHACLARQTSA